LTLLLSQILQLFNLTFACFLRQYFNLLVVVFAVAAEDVRWLHRSTPLRTEKALDHEASLEAKCVTVVANPVNFWDILQAEA